MNNFILHPDRKGSQKTDCDILGLRFPYRAEFSESNDFDEEEFRIPVGVPYFLIAEVTTSQCKLNGPWTEPDKQNVNVLLAALGLFERDEIGRVAEQLYEQGRCATQKLYCSLFCVGRSTNDELKRQYPSVPQKTWKDLVFFIHSRFDQYGRRKKDHPQWDETGRQLWNLFERNRDRNKFLAQVVEVANLPVPPNGSLEPTLKS